MATTARNKHWQMLKEAEAAAEAENILIQETTDESENDFNYLSRNFVWYNSYTRISDVSADIF